MGKLVILKLGAGSFEQGFPVTLAIGEETTQLSQRGNSFATTLETPAHLPPAPDLLQAYHQWQTLYRALDLRGRPIGMPKPKGGVTLAECQNAANQLRDRLNQWLQTDSFRPVREKWLETLKPSDIVRAIFQTDNHHLQKLPWHLWDVIERYPHTEIALSAPAYEQIARTAVSAPKIRILAILGNSEGIDIQTDRALLEQLPNAHVEFLVEPQREALTNHLWEQHWDILFFAGHSSSHSIGEMGQMSINATESLTISQLKYALRKAVQRGLTLAIFNSCDGLGLAREFADLQIPQLIVMREPIPDRVAQTFLKYFLDAFSRGELLYLAVREARERLQGLEGEFPCATWLPVIFQNPAERPPTWNTLLGRQDTFPSKPPDRQVNRRAITSKGNLLRTAVLVPLVSLSVTTLMLGIRHLGWLQSLELPVFDRLLQQRPDEAPDGRILVVTVTEADVQAQPPNERRGSLSDAALAKVLEKLEAAKPRVIGLDIYRDYPVEKSHPKLAAQMKQNQGFVAVCRVSNAIANTPSVAPPPEVDSDRIGFSDLAVDSDRIVRRHLLALDPPLDSPCAASYAFSTQLALRYLDAQGVELKFMPDGAWKLGNTIIQPIESHIGGYQGIDAWGHQILLNYRSYRSIQDIVPQITLSQVLAGKLNAEMVKDRIVLIGTTAESFQDISPTPYRTLHGETQAIPGVLLQAQLISQLLSTVLDQRSLLWALPFWGDAVWILGWAVAGSLLGLLHRPKFLIGTIVGAIVILYGASLGLLIWLSCWIPLVPAALALVGSSASTFTLKHSLTRKEHYE